MTPDASPSDFFLKPRSTHYFMSLIFFSLAPFQETPSNLFPGTHSLMHFLCLYKKSPESLVLVYMVGNFFVGKVEGM